MPDSGPGTQGIAYNPAHSLYTASGAGLQRSMIAVEANFHRVTSPIKSRVHGIVNHTSTNGANMKTRIAMECVFHIACLISGNRPSAILADHLIFTVAFQPM